MKVNNEIAQAVIAECMSAMPEDLVVDGIIALHHGETRTKGAQIVVECLKRVMPDITPGEYVQACSDVLRYFVDGDDLDYVPADDDVAQDIERIDEMRTR